MPGGVSSPVRAFRAVGGDPLFIERGEGAYLVDVDGNRYLDYVLSWGPLILGHAHPRVVAALEEAVRRGTSYGAPSPLELELARLIREAMPSVELVRFVSSGTEATMSALRLARAFTERSKIVKFTGCYHGHADLLLVQAGSGVATLGLPDSPGVTPGAVADTLDRAVQRSSMQSSDCSPSTRARSPRSSSSRSPGTWASSRPLTGFLEGLRALTEADGALLVFDEVMTGFRVHPGGAQALYGIVPDLTTLGKVIGGGLPVGAYGGRREIMELVAPAGPVYQAGTLSGNPLAMTAGIETLRALTEPGMWEGIVRAAERLGAGLGDAAAEAGSPPSRLMSERCSASSSPNRRSASWEDAKRADTERFAAFHRGMLERGVYLAPSQFEAWFLSTAHGDDEIDMTSRRGTRDPRLARLTSTLPAGEGAPRHALLPAGGRRRRAAAAEARAIPPCTRHRDPRARAGRSEVGAPRSRPSRPDAGVDAPRPLRRAEGEEADRGARSGGGARAGAPAGAGHGPPTALARRERDVEPHCDPRGDPHRPPRGDRRDHDDVSARLDPLRRRRGQAGDRRRAGSPTSAIPSSPTSTGGPTRPRRAPGRRRTSSSRGWSLAEPTRSRASPTRSPTRCGGSSRAGSSARSRTGATSTTSPGSSTGPRRASASPTQGAFFGKRDPRPFLQALERLGRRRGRPLRRRLP